MLIVQRLSARFLNKGERTNGVLSGSMLMLISTLISTLTRVGLISILARIYSKDQFGIWVTITSATAVMATSDFGIGNALRNKLSELRVKNDTSSNDEGREYFLSVVYFFLTLALTFSILLLAFQSQIPYYKLFKITDPSIQAEVGQILLAVQIIFLFSIPLGIGSTMFFAYLESKWVAFFNIINGILSILVIGTLAWMGKSITVSAILFFLISLLISVAGTIYFLYLRKWDLFHLNPRMVLRRVWSLLGMSFKFAILQMSGAFMYNAMTLVVSAEIGLTDAAGLNLVQKLYTFIIAIYLSLYNPLWAGYSDAIYRNDWVWVKKTLTRTMLLTSLLFGAVLFLFTFSGNFFLQLLAGGNYTSQSLLFLLMGLWALGYSLYSVGVAFLSASGKINTITILTTIFAFCFVSIAVYCGRRWGITGVSFWSAGAFLLLTGATYYQSYFIINRSVTNNV